MLPLAFNINIYFYSTDRLHNPHQTVAALDLGGGSTQITFAPKGLVSLDLHTLYLYLISFYLLTNADTKTMEVAPQGFIHQVAALHQKIDVYSFRYHIFFEILQNRFNVKSFSFFSYLGLGLMAARKQILSVGHADGELTLRSPCINPMIKKGWNYSGVNYIVM